MGKLRQDMYHTAVEANYYLEHTSDDGLIEWERTYLRRLLEITAADGSFYTQLDALWPQNVKWLVSQGFTVMGNDDEGYTISWGRSY